MLVSGQPLGILSTTGIGDVAGGTNGAVPTYANIIELETDVAAANADVGSLGYLTTPGIRGRVKQVFTNSTYGEIPLWTGDPQNRPAMGVLNGYPAGARVNVTLNTDERLE